MASTPVSPPPARAGSSEVGGTIHQQLPCTKLVNMISAITSIRGETDCSSQSIGRYLGDRIQSQKKSNPSGMSPKFDPRYIYGAVLEVNNSEPQPIHRSSSSHSERASKSSFSCKPLLHPGRLLHRVWFGTTKRFKGIDWSRLKT